MGLAGVLRCAYPSLVAKIIMPALPFNVKKTVQLQIIYCHFLLGIMNRGDAMIGDRIKVLRERMNISQSELAKRLSVTRSSVNSWESGLSAPTAIYIIELAKFFHVSTDYLLGIESNESISLSGLSQKEIAIIYQLIDYFSQD